MNQKIIGELDKTKIYFDEYIDGEGEYLEGDIWYDFGNNKVKSYQKGVWVELECINTELVELREFHRSKRYYEEKNGRGEKTGYLRFSKEKKDMLDEEELFKI